MIDGSASDGHSGVVGSAGLQMIRDAPFLCPSSFPIKFQSPVLKGLPASACYTQPFRYPEPLFIAAIGKPSKPICPPRAGGRMTH